MVKMEKTSNVKTFWFRLRFLSLCYLGSPGANALAFSSIESHRHCLPLAVKFARNYFERLVCLHHLLSLLYVIAYFGKGVGGCKGARSFRQPVNDKEPF